MSALDEVEYGVIVLNEAFEARFINRAVYRMWALPSPPDGAAYSFTDILEHGRQTGLYVTAPGSVEDYVRQRKGRLRLTDGRVVKFECKLLPSGGRVITFADISDVVRAEEQLKSLATIDELTKLPNRRHFLQSLERQFERAQHSDLPLSVLMIDADDFKLINDRHGHFVGDDVLKALAERLAGSIRRTDLLGRLGGEEFAAALVETTMTVAIETAERIRRRVEAEPFDAGDRRIWVTVSVGVATRQSKHDNAAELLLFADKALYAAKEAGRNRVVPSSTE
jgi:diguanylate cyclase (GGDEF)-like protein